VIRFILLGLRGYKTRTNGWKIQRENAAQSKEGFLVRKVSAARFCALGNRELWLTVSMRAQTTCPFNSYCHISQGISALDRKGYYRSAVISSRYKL
jgi:hypothetical protein